MLKIFAFEYVEGRFLGQHIFKMAYMNKSGFLVKSVLQNYGEDALQMMFSDLCPKVDDIDSFIKVFNESVQVIEKQKEPDAPAGIIDLRKAKRLY